MNDQKVKALLEEALGDVDDALQRDLWPEMRRRIDQRSVRVSAFDWALIAAVMAWAVIFPESLLALFYHL